MRGSAWLGPPNARLNRARSPATGTLTNKRRHPNAPTPGIAGTAHAQPDGMFHCVGRAAPGRLLFADFFAARALWVGFSAAFPELHALCVMPDHIRLILPDRPGLRLGHAMSAYARWVVAHRPRASETRWSPHPPAEAIPDALHLRRTLRYVLLNPCRAGLARDPLAWPWSTHRDRVGFAATPVGPIETHLPLRGTGLADPILDAAVRAVGDPRFQDELPLFRRPAWRRYADRAARG